MTLINYALTTKEKVKTALGITDSTKDALIEQTINGVSSFIQKYCGRNFLNQEYSEIRDTEGKRTIFLDQYPVTELSSVKYRSGTPSTPVWIAYSADSYLLYDKAGYIKFFGRFPNVSQGVQVNYTAGYLIDFNNETDITKHTLPFDLTQICTDLVSKNVNLSYSQGISSETTEGQTVSFLSDSKLISDNQKSVLDSYKIKRV